MKRITRFVLNLLAVAALLPSLQAAPRHMEALGRGVVAIHQNDGSVYVSWRILRTDPDEIRFNIYCTTGSGEPSKLNSEPLAGPTLFIDKNPPLAQENAYFVRPILAGAEQKASAPFKLPAGSEAKPYLSVPLQTPEGYIPNDASVGDLDGDGEYEIVLHQTGRAHDNSQGGETDPPILQAYKLDGKLLWTINLGKNIREGAHYTQFLVYDFDGDGRAEIVCKTADGTTDGKGKVLGKADADYRNKFGYILSGPEYFTVFDGLTGAELVTTKYIPPRHPRNPLNPSSDELKQEWGDGYGNRFDRFLACVAYLDGVRPSFVLCRGYYTRTVLAAWNWRDGKLTNVWTFDSDDPAHPKNKPFAGQGNHNLSVADVDGDGKDEIIYGGMCIDDNGKGLWTTGLGHGDAMHVSDLDPDRPGLEEFRIQERFDDAGAHMIDVKTGEVLWKKPSTSKGSDGEGPGRGLALDIDPRTKGMECWAFGAGVNGLFDCKGNVISDKVPGSCNFGVWWDGDLLREILDKTWIAKWNWKTSSLDRILTAEGVGSNNGTKATPALSADILGDWREEVIWRSSDAKELRIYTTTIPTTYRFPTLMHDPEYRLSVAWQNVSYNQPPHTSYYLGEGMVKPPRANITTALVTAETSARKPLVASAAAAPGGISAPAQARIKEIVAQQRAAEESRAKIPELKGQPRALLIVKTSADKARLVRANAVNAQGNIVAAELAGGGKGVWQKDFVKTQLPWPTAGELVAKTMDAEPLLARYQAAATAFPELKLALEAEAAPIKSALAAKAKIIARYTTLAALQYDPEHAYSTEELESMLADAEMASADEPEKKAEIAQMLAPFREHLERLAAGEQRVAGVWHTAEEVQFDAFAKELSEHQIDTLVLTRAQFLGAVKLPLIGAGAALLLGLVLTVRQTSRGTGIFLLLLTLGSGAYGVYALMDGEPLPAKTDDAGADKVAHALFLGSGKSTAAPDEAALKLTAQDLNAFSTKFIKITEPSTPTSRDLQRYAYSVGFRGDQIFLFEHVRFSGKESTIRYELKPINGATDQSLVGVESVQIGTLPAPSSLRTLLWQNASTELAKVLRPGIDGLQIHRLDNGIMELAARATPSPAPPVSP